MKVKTTWVAIRNATLITIAHHDSLACINLKSDSLNGMDGIPIIVASYLVQIHQHGMDLPNISYTWRILDRQTISDVFTCSYSHGH